VRVVIVSHPCVLPANQEFFARVAAVTGWDIAIVLPRWWRSEYGESRWARSPQFTGPLRPLPVLGAGNIPLHVYLARLSRVVAECSPDAVYVHHEPYAAVTAQVRRALIRARFHGPFGFYSAQNLMKRYPWPIRRWEQQALARAAFALPVSEEVATVLRRKGYAGSMRVLPLGVDTRRIRPGTRDDGPAFTVGYVGRLSEEKGVDTLLRAMARVGDAGVRCEIVGDGPAAGELAELIGTLALDRRVEWRGYVAHGQVADIYERIDVIVVPSRTTPSWKEQFGRVVIEALASGVPVITSDSGELPRLVAETGGGWTYAEDDVDALAARITHARDAVDERRRKAATGRAAVVRKYDVNVVARSFAEEIERAISASRSGE